MRTDESESNSRSTSINTQTSDSTTAKPGRLKTWQRRCLITLSVVLLYTVVGFFVLPELLRSLVEDKLAERSGRSVSLQKLELNPFDFSVTLRDFSWQGTETEQLLVFQRLYLNLSVRHLFVGELVFENLAIEKPSVGVLINESGELNWQLLVEQLTGDSAGDSAGVNSEPQSEEQQPEDSAPVAVRVIDFVLQDGTVEFNDHSHATPYRAVLSPIELKLQNFSTQPESDAPYAFHAILDHGSSFRWGGDIGINPLRSTGVFELEGVAARGLWEYIQDQVAFEVFKGELSLKARYHFDGSGEEPLVQLFDGVYQLEDFTMGFKRASDNLISVPGLTLSGIQIDTLERKVNIEELATRDGQISSQLKRTGEVDLVGLFASAQELSDSSEVAPEEQASSASESSANSSPANEPEQPWAFSLERFDVNDYRIDFSDHTNVQTPSWTASTINITGGPVEFPQQQPVTLGVELEVDDGTHVRVSGDVLFTPKVTLDIAFTDIDLTRIQPYLDSHVQLQLQQGKASVEGKLNWQGGGDPQLAFEGLFQVNDLLTLDKIDHQEFVKWQSLLIEGIDFDQAQNRLSVSKISTNKPYARVIVYPDLTVNVGQVLSPPESSAGSQDQAASHTQEVSEKSSDDVASVEADSAESGAVDANAEVSMPTEEKDESARIEVAATEDSVMAINIDQIIITDGEANFADLSLQPQFATGIHMLNGSIKGLTSNPAGRADVDISGKVDRYAPVKITGAINPLSAQAYTDLRLSFANVELTTLTPYSGKFAGYTISKGKLSLDLQYLLEDRKLKGDNRMTLDQLTLGERIDSPDATTLPVTMAIALMKDSQGRINIDLPVSGDLDNPEFSYGALLVKALTNLITNIISSPFRALGSLLGDDAESFGEVGFVAASSELSTDVRERLSTLVKALAERPSIKLELTGGVNSDFDWPVIARQQLDAQRQTLAWQHLKAQGQSVPEKPEDMLVPAEMQTLILQQRYRELYAPELAAEAMLPGDDEIIAMLLEQMPPQKPVLRGLAQARAGEIRRYMLEELQFDTARLYLMEVDIDAVVENGKVSARLSLTD